jgi:flagella basal body P-ring formation protein FlgA
VTGCQATDNQTVVAHDVAAIIPAFAQLPPDFLLGYVPSSGGQRIFRGEELERIAKNRGLDLHGLDDVCFVRRMIVPDETQIRTAMEKTLALPAVKIEIESSSHTPVPVGELVFPRSGVQRFQGLEVTWHGYVQAGESARFPVWARARITASLSRVVAVGDLHPGKLIQRDQVRLEVADDSPFDDTPVRDLNDVIGFLSKVTVPNSEAVRKAQVERPMDVARGAVIRVDVFEGRAHLTLEARAQTAGMKGSIVTVRNLDSGREFRAEVTGKDQVVVGGHAE